MKKILVTGCNGQLGRAIRKEYEQDEVTFVNTDVVDAEGVTALDITNIETTSPVLLSFKCKLAIFQGNRLCIFRRYSVLKK